MVQNTTATMIKMNAFILLFAAALLTAGQLAKRIAVITTLPRSIVPLEELVRRYGFAERASVTACNAAVLDLEKPGSGAEEKLNAEIATALDKGPNL